MEGPMAPPANVAEDSLVGHEWEGRRLVLWRLDSLARCFSFDTEFIIFSVWELESRELLPGVKYKINNSTPPYLYPVSAKTTDWEFRIILHIILTDQEMSMEWIAEWTWYKKKICLCFDRIYSYHLLNNLYTDAFNLKKYCIFLFHWHFVMAIISSGM